MAVQLCLGEAGVFVGEKTQLTPYIETKQLKIINHKDAIKTERLGLICHKQWATSPALNSLVELFKTHFN